MVIIKLILLFLGKCPKGFVSQVSDLWERNKGGLCIPQQECLAYFPKLDICSKSGELNVCNINREVSTSISKQKWNLY